MQERKVHDKMDNISKKWCFQASVPQSEDFTFRVHISNKKTHFISRKHYYKNS